MNATQRLTKASLPPCCHPRRSLLPVPVPRVAGGGQLCALRGCWRAGRGAGGHRHPAGAPSELARCGAFGGCARRATVLLLTLDNAWNWCLQRASVHLSPTHVAALAALPPLQALEAIKLVSGVGEPLSRRLLAMDCATGRFHCVKLRAK